MAMTDANLSSFIETYCGLKIPVHYYDTVWGGDILTAYTNCKWGHWLSFAGTAAVYYEDLTIPQFTDQIFGLLEYMIIPEKKEYKWLLDKVEDYRNGDISYEDIINELIGELQKEFNISIQSMIDFVILNELAIQYTIYTVTGSSPNINKWGFFANTVHKFVSQLANFESDKRNRISLLITFADKLRIGWVYPIPP